MPSNINSVIKKNKIEKKNYFRPTDPNFFQHVTVNTHIFFFLPYNICSLTYLLHAEQPFLAVCVISLMDAVLGCLVEGIKKSGFWILQLNVGPLYRSVIMSYMKDISRSLDTGHIQCTCTQNLVEGHMSILSYLTYVEYLVHSPNSDFALPKGYSNY